jgi:hypothetical protein
MYRKIERGELRAVHLGDRGPLRIPVDAEQAGERGGPAGSGIEREERRLEALASRCKTRTARSQRSSTPIGATGDVRRCRTRGPEFESRRPDGRKPRSGGVFVLLLSERRDV